MDSLGDRLDLVDTGRVQRHRHGARSFRGLDAACRRAAKVLSRWLGRHPDRNNEFGRRVLAGGELRDGSALRGEVQQGEGIGEVAAVLIIANTEDEGIGARGRGLCRTESHIGHVITLTTSV